MRTPKANRIGPTALGTLLLCALVAPGACNSTDNPRESYVRLTPGARNGSGGRSGSGDSSDGGSAPIARGGRSDASAAGSVSMTGNGGGCGDIACPQAGAGASDSGPSGTGGSAGQTGDGAGGDSSNPTDIDCGSAPISTGPFTREALRAAAADCAMWHHCQFESAAGTLSERVRSYVESPDDLTQARAQRAFREAMKVWSKLELFQFGPLSSKSDTAGKDSYQGQGLRDLIYAWPSTARCRVEEQLASRSFATDGLSLALISARGLFGLEYCLFYSGADTACAASSPAGKLWPSLSEAELSARKRDYALALAEDVLAQAQTLSRAWSSEGGNFRPIFVSASGYPNDQEALNVMGFSLIYVERELKDWKLGIPAGYTLTHPVNGPESPFALLGTENIRENLRGFRSLFEGCGPNGEGLGFDDWLLEAGHAQLATDLLSALSAAQSAAEAFPPLHEASLSELEVFYQAIKALTDLLKNDLFGAGSPLNLKLPAGVEGDTD